MSDQPYTKEDRALFVDLDRAARAAGTEPCLIGAGAIQLGSDARWTMRLRRRTKDWDFAVRVDSWEQFERLAAELESGGHFTRDRAPQRFHHVDGGFLDVVPYGDLEKPKGQIEWPDAQGIIMNTRGLSVLDSHHDVLELDEVSIRSASRPAVIGLKLLAYLDRRPGVLRDIQDVHALLRGAEDCAPNERIEAEGLPVLSTEEVGFGEIGAYLLGRDVGAIFQAKELAPILVLLETVGQLEDRTVGDILQSPDAARFPREQVIDRFRALRVGIRDGQVGGANAR